MVPRIAILALALVATTTCSRGTPTQAVDTTPVWSASMSLENADGAATILEVECFFDGRRVGCGDPGQTPAAAIRTFSRIDPPAPGPHTYAVRFTRQTVSPATYRWTQGSLQREYQDPRLNRGGWLMVFTPDSVQSVATGDAVTWSLDIP